MEDAIVMEVDIEAPPERVFRALLDPQELVQWWKARDVTWELDARVGGKWRSTGADDSCGAYEMWGEILELDPPRVLAYTWTDRTSLRTDLWQSTVRYELAPTAQGTRLKLTHSGFAERKHLEDYRGGWPGVLQELREFFTVPVA